MSDVLNRAHLSLAERRFRSRIAQLASSRRLIRGCLSVRNRKCGKPNDQCASGELHSSLYPEHREAGQRRQIYRPRQKRESVRRAVSDYQGIQKLLEEIFELEWKRLKHRSERIPFSDVSRKAFVSRLLSKSVFRAWLRPSRTAHIYRPGRVGCGITACAV